MELEIRNLSQRHANGVQALDDVSLVISPGMFGLLGRNGAGKSTLMRILATLQGADTGSVRFGDMDVLREGRVLHTGDPLALANSLRGRIWQKFIEKRDLAVAAADPRIISTRRLAGRLLLRLHADEAPEAGFEAVEPDLEDFYFFALEEAGRAGVKA